MSLGLAGIYCIRNIVSGRVYVGSAVKIKDRWRLHRSRLNRGKHHSVLLQRSWTKHGSEAFSFEVIENVPAEQLIAREQFWIESIDACNPQTGFNVAPKAGSSLGRKHPPEVIALMRLQRAGRKKPPRTAEHCAALSAGRIGNQWSKGIPKTEEHKRNQSKVMKGRKMPWVGESNKRRAAASRLTKSLEITS